MSSSFHASMSFLASTDLDQSQITEGVPLKGAADISFPPTARTRQKVDNKSPSNVLQVPPHGNWRKPKSAKCSLFFVVTVITTSAPCGAQADRSLAKTSPATLMKCPTLPQAFSQYYNTPNKIVG